MGKKVCSSHKICGFKSIYRRRYVCRNDKANKPRKHQRLRRLCGLLSQIKSHIIFIESDLHQKLNRLSCYECSRLDEALVAFSNYCFTASVAMAVSAVENRLVELIRKKNKTLYVREFRRFTLGQLIRVFDENEYKEKKYSSIKKLLPAKHKPLLLLLNQYRIFPVHPTGEPVTPQIAEAIVHLSFAFMFDEHTCPYTSAELECV